MEPFKLDGTSMGQTTRLKSRKSTVTFFSRRPYGVLPGSQADHRQCITFTSNYNGEKGKRGVKCSA